MQNIEKIEVSYPMLKPFLREDRETGLAFSSDAVNNSQKNRKTRLLKYYYADRITDKIIQHNIMWAQGKKDKPIFQFAYIMMPTICNQACCGCFMGQDKGKLPKHLDGPYFSDHEISDILQFLKQHGAKAIVYGGGGELFTWGGAFNFIEQVAAAGIHPVLFTNGTLLTKDDVKRLNSLGAVLIISLRDTVEYYHNKIVGACNFRSSLAAIEFAITEGLHHDGRLAVEIPVTRYNEERVVKDLLPILRNLNIVPMIEEYIQISVSKEEQATSHNFAQSRSFFKNISRRDEELDVFWQPEFGARMIDQPKCRRPLYSFAIFPSRDVLDCPSHSINYGNLRAQSLESIIYSESFKKNILDFNLCACSVFYTESNGMIPNNLPENLVVFK